MRQFFEDTICLFSFWRHSHFCWKTIDFAENLEMMQIAAGASEGEGSSSSHHYDPMRTKIDMFAWINNFESLHVWVIIDTICSAMHLMISWWVKIFPLVFHFSLYFDLSIFFSLVLFFVEMHKRREKR